MQPEFVNKGRIERPVDYVLDNSSEMAEAQYSELSALYYAQTIRQVERSGFEERWHCFEIGAGGSSIASWLCQPVGDQGRVLAADLGRCFLGSMTFGNLEVRHHDDRAGGLPEREFSLNSWPGCGVPLSWISSCPLQRCGPPGTSPGDRNEPVENVVHQATNDLGRSRPCLNKSKGSF